MHDPIAFVESFLGPLAPWQQEIVRQLANPDKQYRSMCIVRGRGKMSRIDLTNRLNRQWWNEAMEIIAQNIRRLNDWEANFVRDMQEVAEFGNPTVKQFNQLREIARKVKA